MTIAVAGMVLCVSRLAAIRPQFPSHFPVTLR